MKTSATSLVGRLLLRTCDRGQCSFVCRSPRAYAIYPHRQHERHIKKSERWYQLNRAHHDHFGIRASNRLTTPRPTAALSQLVDFFCTNSHCCEQTTMSSPRDPADNQLPEYKKTVKVSFTRLGWESASHFSQVIIKLGSV